MNAILIGMLAETFVHPGVGQAISAIDLPVARERVTDYPFIPGSGVKGGWKTWAEERADLKAHSDRLFGKQENAGAILFSDARLALLPVRSLNTAYVWLTCPLLLERLERDIRRMGGTPPFSAADVTVADGTYLSPAPSSTETFKALPQELALEERELTRAGDIPAAAKAGVIAALKALVPAAVAARVPPQLAIVSDKEFAWFAKYALPVSAHNALSEKKTSTALWYEETLPPDTVMYAILAERPPENGAGAEGSERPENGAAPRHDLKLIAGKLAAHPYCQFGGNETLGQGWFQVMIAYKNLAAAPAANVGEAA